MTTSRFAGIGGHHSNRPQTVEWLTPPAILDALGGHESFDLDPATPDVQPWPTARHRFTKADDGLAQDWKRFDRFWLNPPYTNGIIGKWLAKAAHHGRGTTIIFARTETDAFFRHVWEQASALLFLRGRLNFHYPDGTRAAANSGAPTVLCAYGMRDADILAFCGLNGQFVPLRFPRSVLVAAIGSETWREVAAAALRDARGPVALADLYRAVADHPKAKMNPHWRAKLRQVLQIGRGTDFLHVGRGQWRAA
jgi:phage N-6-adenine-methyltransferase